MIATLIAVALVWGAPLPLIGVVWLASARPSWFLAGCVAWGAYHRLRRPRDPGPRAEAAFLEGMAAELRSGASLRGAIADASERTEIDLVPTVRLAQAGRPIDEVAEGLGAALAVNGSVVGPALSLASSSGSSVAGLFDALAVRAAEAAEEERERRSLTAQARLSAWLIAGLPSAVAVGVFAFGDLSLSSDPGRSIAIVGFGLQAAGALVVWRMARGGSS